MNEGEFMKIRRIRRTWKNQNSFIKDFVGGTRKVEQPTTDDSSEFALLESDDCMPEPLPVSNTEALCATVAVGPAPEAVSVSRVWGVETNICECHRKTSTSHRGSDHNALEISGALSLPRSDPKLAVEELLRAAMLCDDFLVFFTDAAATWQNVQTNNSSEFVAIYMKQGLNQEGGTRILMAMGW